MCVPSVLTKVLYMLRCAVGGFITIFLPIFFNQLGFSPLQIGLITALGPVAGIVGSPLWGALADTKPGIRKKIMIGLSITSLCCNCSFVVIALISPKEMQFPLTLTACCLQSFTGNSVGSFLDAIVIEQVPANTYGKLRLWCSVGYGSAAGIVGVAMIYVDPSILWVPYVTHFAPAVLCALTSLVLILFLEEKKPTTLRKINNNASIQESNEKENLLKLKTEDVFFARLKKVPKTLDSLFFCLVVFVCGCCKGIVDSFLFIFIADTLHGSQLVMGISVLVTCVFNILVFYYAEHALNYFTPDWTLLISVIAYVLRIGLYWEFGLYKVNPWYILFAETLHGFTFALMWSSAISKTSQLVEGLNLTNFAVGLISAVLTFGTATGSFVAGLILKQGFAILWIWQYLTLLIAIIGTLWYLQVLHKKVIKGTQNPHTLIK